MCKIYLLGVISLLVTNTAFNVVIYSQTYSLGGDWKPGEIEKFSAEDDRMVSADEAGGNDLDHPDKDVGVEVGFEGEHAEMIVEAEDANDASLKIDVTEAISVGRADSTSSHGSISATWKTVL